MDGKYDFLIVGSGLFGSVWARQCVENRKTCIILEKRNHAGGNAYSERRDGIDVHLYGPHIFNTNDQKIWEYANDFDEFVEYRHRVIAVNDGRPYSFPVNLLTMYQVHGRGNIPDLIPLNGNEATFESLCLATVGRKMYDLFYRDYTWKQWGIDPKELPASIATRIPVHYNHSDHYHNSLFSGIPRQGYNIWTMNMRSGVLVETNSDWENRQFHWNRVAHRLVWTGPLDEYYNFALGVLPYRSLHFDHKYFINTSAVDLGVAQINYTDANTIPTREVEHRHFMSSARPRQKGTWITTEYSKAFDPQDHNAERFYPMPTQQARSLRKRYLELASSEKDVIFGGRLGTYQYLNMDQTIAQALHKFEEAMK